VGKSRFSGPLFIVGMPRSGTKLIRDLLNQNSKIGIPVIESHFILNMINKYGKTPHLEKKNIRESFFEDFQKTVFFRRRKRKGFALKQNNLNEITDKNSWSSIFEVIFRFYAPLERDDKFIWGDKCPSLSYLANLSLLKEIFPTAKFLHIIRDPRDGGLSMKKSWMMTLYSSAERWRQSMETARSQGKKIGNDYMEIYYESLLDNPQNTLIDVCNFVGINFIDNMLYLDKPASTKGDTGKCRTVLRTNKKKFLSQLSPTVTKRIEEIVFPEMKKTPYEFEYAKNFIPLNPLSFMAHRGYNKIVNIVVRIKAEIGGRK